jgi:hypothetical protein
MFRFAWLIVGAVLFWRDCPDAGPKVFNNTMWAMLIMGFLGLGSSSGAAGAAKAKQA